MSIKCFHQHTIYQHLIINYKTKVDTKNIKITKQRRIDIYFKFCA